MSRRKSEREEEEEEEEGNEWSGNFESFGKRSSCLVGIRLSLTDDREVQVIYDTEYFYPVSILLLGSLTTVQLQQFVHRAIDAVSSRTKTSTTRRLTRFCLSVLSLVPPKSPSSHSVIHSFCELPWNHSNSRLL